MSMYRVGVNQRSRYRVIDRSNVSDRSMTAISPHRSNRFLVAGVPVKPSVQAAFRACRRNTSPRLLLGVL